MVKNWLAARKFDEFLMENCLWLYVMECSTSDFSLKNSQYHWLLRGADMNKFPWQRFFFTFNLRNWFLIDFCEDCLRICGFSFGKLSKVFKDFLNIFFIFHIYLPFGVLIVEHLFLKDYIRWSLVLVSKCVAVF